MALSLLLSCRGENPEQDARIPKGESCILRTKDAFCIDQTDRTTQFKSFAEIRGHECIGMDYKAKMEHFIYDILKENEELRDEMALMRFEAQDEEEFDDN